MFQDLQRNDTLILLIPATIVLCWFRFSGGEALWTKTLQKRQTLERKPGIVARTDCIKSIADYILAAVATFIGTYMIAAFLRDRNSVSAPKQHRLQSINVGWEGLRAVLWKFLLLFLMCYPELGLIKSGEAELAEVPGREILGT
jgi:hypothetical protein